MPIRYFGDEIGVNVQTPGDLLEAIDMLHTQVLDNFPEEDMAPYLAVLEVALNRMHELVSSPVAIGGEEA
jgi:hypothetical protein